MNKVVATHARKTRYLAPENLRKYQWKGIKFALLRKCCALFMDMGLGKTIVVLSVIKALMHKGRLDKPVLIVGPIRVIHGVWAQEAAEWTHTRKLSFSVVHGSEKQRIQALDMPANVYLINPENLVWLLNLMSNRKALRKFPFSMLVIDESDAFKAENTKRFRKLKDFLHYFKWRIILSGSPTPNRLQEIWTQMYIVDMGDRLGEDYKRFHNRFFQPENEHSERPVYVPRRGTERYIYGLIGDIALSMEAKDYIDMPPTVLNPVYVDLPPVAREIYDEFEREMFYEMEEGDVEAITASVLSTKCHQIANGAVYSTDRDTQVKIWERVHDAKMEALKEIVRETGSPVLVAYWFKHDLFRLHKEFPNAPWFGRAKNNDLENEWNAGKHDVVFIHPLSAAHGMNLQKGPGHTIALFSLLWAYGRYKQLISRVGNARAQRRVMVHHLIARNTTDEAIMNAMRRKAHGQDNLMQALKEYKRVRQTDAEELF